MPFAISERIRELKAKRPFLLLAGCQRLIGIVERNAVAVWIEQIFAEAAIPVQAGGVELRQQKILASRQDELSRLISHF